jgi:hypothetical protein
VICDGNNTIWWAASSQPVLHDAVWILDYYHASENLKKAAIAIFGDNDEATRWLEKLRDKLLLDDRAVENTIRTMRRCRGRASPGSDRRNVVDNAIKYFRIHRERIATLCPCPKSPRS